ERPRVVHVLHLLSARSGWRGGEERGHAHEYPSNLSKHVVPLEMAGGGRPGSDAGAAMRGGLPAYLAARPLAPTGRPVTNGRGVSEPSDCTRNAPSVCVPLLRS